MDLEPHIVVPAQHTFTGVYPYPNTDRTLSGPGMLGQRALNLSGGSGCVTSTDKDEKEAVSPLSNLDPTGLGYGLPKQMSVSFQNFPVSCTKPLNKPGGAFDVCKDEGNRPCR
jgi:hypothetical protein